MVLLGTLSHAIFGFEWPVQMKATRKHLIICETVIKALLSGSSVTHITKNNFHGKSLKILNTEQMKQGPNLKPYFGQLWAIWSEEVPIS